MYKSEFKKMCSQHRINDDELNNMTLEEFVYLFAFWMPEIFENEKNLQKVYDNAAAGYSTTRGGSKNKSRKRSTRKPRRSRRHRRRTTTRKYKKLYK